MKKLFLISIAAVCAAMICSCTNNAKAELSPAHYLTFEIAGEGESVCLDTCVAEAADAQCFGTKVMLDENGYEIGEDGSEGECADTVVAPDPVYDPMAGLIERVEKANANYKSVPVNEDEIDGILEEYFVEFQGKVNAKINVYITPVLTANFANVQKQLFRTYTISSQEAAFENLAVEE